MNQHKDLQTSIVRFQNCYTLLHKERPQLAMLGGLLQVRIDPIDEESGEKFSARHESDHDLRIDLLCSQAAELVGGWVVVGMRAVSSNLALI